MNATHKIEEIVTTNALVMIGCECGWTHEERRGFDTAQARKACRKAFAEHKAAS
jgi:16S rRNA U1498 N3-methylase RsmE